MLNDGELYQVFKHCAALKSLAQVHAENGDVIAQVLASLLLLDLCEYKLNTFDNSVHV